MNNPNKVVVSVIVNGQPLDVEVNLNAPLQVVAQHALNQSGNSGQPLDNWEMRDADGQVLDLSRKAGDFGLANGTKLFLNLKAGVGG